jgi:hypothetical protein
MVTGFINKNFKDNQYYKLLVTESTLHIN